MSERAVSTGKLMILMLTGVVLLSAIALYLVVNNEVGVMTCQVEEDLLGNFHTPKKKVSAPDTVFFDGAGNERRLTDLRGRGIILNFWASWCAPCVREMPQLDRLKALVVDNSVEVLAVSQDRQGARLVKKFLAENKLYNLEPLIDKDSKLIQAVSGRGLPTTILFDREGQEIGRTIGVAEWGSTEVIKFIRKCLGN